MSTFTVLHLMKDTLDSQEMRNCKEIQGEKHRTLLLWDAQLHLVIQSLHYDYHSITKSEQINCLVLVASVYQGTKRINERKIMAFYLLELLNSYSATMPNILLLTTTLW